MRKGDKAAEVVQGSMERQTLAAGCLVVLALPVFLPGGHAMPTEWPTVQGHFARTGFHGEIDGPGTGEVVWRYRTDSLYFDALPAVANGRVYLGDGDGLLHAIGALDGKRVWTYKAAAPIAAPAVVAEQLVYVVDTWGTLHAIREASGRLQWNMETDGSAMLLAHNETLIYGDSKGVLHALDGQTGRANWTFDVNDRPRFSARSFITGSPLAMNDSLIFGSADGYLYSVSLAGGKLQWEIQLENGLYQSPAAGEGFVFVLDGPRRLCAFHVENGTGEWCTETGSLVTSTPVYRTGTVYVAGRSEVVAVNAGDGTVRWNLMEVAGASTNLAVSPKTAYFTSGHDTMTALDLESRKIIWSRTFTMHTDSSPVVVDGLIYIGTEQYRVFAMDAGAGHDPQRSAQPDRPFPQPIPTISPILLLPILALLRNPRRG